MPILGAPEYMLHGMLLLWGDACSCITITEVPENPFEKLITVLSTKTIK